MSENLNIWSQLEKSDPKHTKKFKRAGGFSGTSLKPIWMIRKMTEVFGPCGTGWGMTKPDFQVVAGAEGETLVYCTVGLWIDPYRVNPTAPQDTSDHIIYGVGGDKVVGKNRNGAFSDDEAFKKSYTDALSNAMKQLGMAADIHMGQHDDDKYVREVEQEFVTGNGNGNVSGNAGNKGTPSLGTGKEKVDEAWGGPLSKTEFKKAMEAFDADLRSCEDMDTLLALLNAPQTIELLNQCQRDRPSWWHTREGSDVQGFNDRIESKRNELKQEQAA